MIIMTKTIYADIRDILEAGGLVVHNFGETGMSKRLLAIRLPIAVASRSVYVSLDLVPPRTTISSDDPYFIEILEAAEIPYTTT